MNDSIDDLISDVQTDLTVIEDIVERWTGYEEALDNLRKEIATLADYLTTL